MYLFLKQVISIGSLVLLSATTGNVNTRTPTLLSQVETLAEENSRLHKTVCDLENKLLILEDIGKGSTQIGIFEDSQKTHNKALKLEIFAYMKERLACPEANYALAVHESGGFSSPFFARSNNMFCMGLNSRGFYDFKIFNGGDNNHKCGYKSWKSAIDDMAGWQASHLRRGNLDISSNEAYIRSLKSVGYATDPAHGERVLSHYNMIFKFSLNGQNQKT